MAHKLWVIRQWKLKLEYVLNMFWFQVYNKYNKCKILINTTLNAVNTSERDYTEVILKWYFVYNI